VAITLPRRAAKLIAEIFGYFYLPCSLCNRQMAGFEWKDYGGHQSSIPDDNKSGVGHGICKRCTLQGHGCREWAERGMIHHDCKFVGAR
jgi:hypothetical protein